MKVADWHKKGLASGLPKVSVATTTYGHENFIGEAIESVLMQDVDFPVEMVIGEDCSPDRTHEMILKYTEQYPGFIHLHRQECNVGPPGNFRTTISHCRGQYVALLDGDDYWTSPEKLRLQVEFLDSNPQFSMCCHAVTRRSANCIVSRIIRPTGRKSVYRLADLARWINIMPLSMVYRRSAVPVLPSWFSDVFFGDWAIQVLLAEKGDIAYLSRVLGTHRIHGANIWCSSPPKRSVAIRMQIEHADLFIKHLAGKRAAPFERAQYRRYFDLVHACLDENEPEAAREVLRKIRDIRSLGFFTNLLEPLLVHLHMWAPGIYRRIRPHLHRLLHPWGLIVRPAFDRLNFLSPSPRQG